MATPPPTDTSGLLARLEGVAAYDLVLAERRTLSDALVELTLTGSLEGLEPAAGNDMMFAVPLEGDDGSFRRRYTIRRLDASAGALTVWIDVSSGGPGSQWARNAPIGSSIEAIGPRGKVVLDPMADWHLFIGDLSFLAASFAMAEAIEPPGQAIFLFEVERAADAPTPGLDEAIGTTFAVIERAGRSGDDPAGLLAGLSALELPEDEGHVYIGGELSVVAALRRALGERGFEPSAIDAKPYWRHGVANLAHGEPRKDDA